MKEKFNDFIKFIKFGFQGVKSITKFVLTIFIQFALLVFVFLGSIYIGIPYELAFIVLVLIALGFNWRDYLQTVPKTLAEYPLEQRIKSLRKLMLDTVLLIVYTWFLVIAIFAWIYYATEAVEDIKPYELEVKKTGNQSWSFRGEVSIGTWSSAHFKYFYLSLVTITTLGDCDYKLKDSAKIITGLEALTGVLVFSISLAMIIFLINQYFEFKKDEIRMKENQTDDFIEE